MPKSRVREMCRLAEFDEIEARLILERFCSGKTVGQCDFLPEDQQRALLPSLNRRVKGWIQHNTGFFCLEELEGIAQYRPEKNPGMNP
ncbi:MAG: hypothetical protein FWG04_05135 [Desulfovibrionaceae bacterium]|nr:hypothetical protein [Desulfovibrionaceae bacterium]